MSKSSIKPAISPEWAKWEVGAPLTPQEEAEIKRLCLLQRQAEEAKERVVAMAQLRVAVGQQKLN